MVNKPKQKPEETFIDYKTAQEIMQGTNEGLKAILTSPQKTNYNTIAYSEEQKEEEGRIKGNDWINNKYVNPNNAEEYMESDYADYDSAQEIENELDKEFLAEAKNTLKPNTIHQGEIMDFDQYGNAIVAIYGGDIQGIIYKAENKGLEIGDHTKVIYRRRNKKKNRFVFDIQYNKARSDVA